MAKQPLKKQQQSPRKPHSRYFREELYEFLDFIKSEIEGGERFEREFEADPKAIDDDCAVGLINMFNRSGLDITAPGHWQFMLVAVVNAYGKNWTRVITDWTECQKNQFAREAAEQRIEGENNSRLELCKRLKEKDGKSYPMDAETLRKQLQAILKEKRERVDDGTADDEDVEILNLYDG
jgi:hypothetical protein